MGWGIYLQETFAFVRKFASLLIVQPSLIFQRWVGFAAHDLSESVNISISKKLSFLIESFRGYGST